LKQKQNHSPFFLEKFLAPKTASPIRIRNLKFSSPKNKK